MQQKRKIQTQHNAFSPKGTFGEGVVRVFNSGLFWVLLISGLVRSFYYSVLVTTTAYDTTGYINYKANILRGETEAFRTPVYPYFIKLIGLFGNKQHLLDNVVTAQIIISFLSIIVFYQIATAIFKSKYVVIVSALIYGVMLPVINFDKMILTESLSAIFTLLFIYQLLKYLQKPGMIKAALITLYIFIAIMLRPSFVYLLPLMILFWAIRLIVFRKDWKACLAGVTAFVMVLLLISGYSNLNEKNGFHGISTVSNNTGIAAVIGANIYQYGNDPAITAAVDSNFEEARKVKLGLKVPVKNYIAVFDANRLSRFISTCIRNQPFAYLGYSVHKMVDLHSENIFTNYASHQQTKRAYTIEHIEYAVFHIPFVLLFLFLAVNMADAAVKVIKRKGTSWFLVSILVLACGQVAVAIIGGFSEYQRLILPAMPAFTLLLFNNIDRVVSALNAARLKSHKPEA